MLADVSISWACVSKAKPQRARGPTGHRVTHARRSAAARVARQAAAAQHTGRAGRLVRLEIRRDAGARGGEGRGGCRGRDGGESGMSCASGGRRVGVEPRSVGGRRGSRAGRW
jgi:hypothetical protein